MFVCVLLCDRGINRTFVSILTKFYKQVFGEKSWPSSFLFFYEFMLSVLIIRFPRVGVSQLHKSQLFVFKIRNAATAWQCSTDISIKIMKALHTMHSVSIFFFILSDSRISANRHLKE